MKKQGSALCTKNNSSWSNESNVWNTRLSSGKEINKYGHWYGVIKGGTIWPFNKYQGSKCGLKSAYEHGQNWKVNVLQTKIIVTYFIFSKWY